LREAVRLDPGNTLAHQDLGRALALQGRLAEAVEPLYRGLPARRDDSEAHRELGHVLTELGRLDEAEAQLELALRIDPGSLGARFGRARVWAARGDAARAADELSELLRLRPDFTEARALLRELRPAPGGSRSGSGPPREQAGEVTPTRSGRSRSK
jgi:tetratricopeptide (TPR) repeat protein